MKGTDSSTIRIGAWRVDAARGQISKDGASIKLERRLMQLLLCLAEQPGQILSVEQLLDRVWAGVVVSPDSVYHTVASLRRILGDDAKTPQYIINIPRRGYSLIAPVAPTVDSVELAVDVPMEEVKDAPTRRAAAPASPRFWSVVIASFAALILALGYGTIERHSSIKPDSAKIPSPPAEQADKPAAGSFPAKSIAVLPFVDLSEHQDQQFFADGMAEEIIDRLVQVPELRVPARTSSFYFKGKSSTLADIAASLGVANVLEGSVRTSGNRIRVIARLVRASDGYHVWSQNYERELRDIFELQDEIATAVAAALQISLAGGTLNRERGGTRNLDAYQLYLRARSAVTGDGAAATIKESQSMLRQAVKIDPNFGLAWTRLAVISLELVDTGIVSPLKGYEEAERLAQHSIAISPGIAEPHAVIAYLYRTRDWNWDASRKEIQLALAADPADPVSLGTDGLLSKTLGQHDKAEHQLQAAVDHDPLFNYANFHLGNALYLAGKFGQAEATFRHLLDISPQFWARPYLAKTLLAQGKSKDAFDALQPADATDKLNLMPIILLANGGARDADAALQALIAKHSATDAYHIGMAYAYRQEKQRALQWLERAYSQRDAGLLDMIGEPLLKNVSSEPRFHAILRAMNLPE